MSAQSYENVAWMHVKSRKIYRITGFPLRESDLMPQVSYRRFDGSGPEFTRLCEEFFDGRYRVHLDFPEAEEPDGEGIATDFYNRSIVPGDVVRPYINHTGASPALLDRWGTSQDRVVASVVNRKHIKLVPLPDGARYDHWDASMLLYVRKATPEEKRCGEAVVNGEVAARPPRR